MFEEKRTGEATVGATAGLGEQASSFAMLNNSLTAMPGPEQIVFLSSLDIEQLDDEAAVLLMRAWERQARWVAAQSQRVIARVAGPRPANFDEDWARETVATALGFAPSTAKCRMEIARQLAGP